MAGPYEWRIDAIEQKANNGEEAYRRLFRLDEISGNVDRLERADRDICALIDGLRDALESTLNRVSALEQTVEELRSTLNL